MPITAYVVNTKGLVDFRAGLQKNTEVEKSKVRYTAGLGYTVARMPYRLVRTLGYRLLKLNTLGKSTTSQHRVVAPEWSGVVFSPTYEVSCLCVCVHPCLVPDKIRR